MMINQHLNESVNHRESKTRFKEMWFVHSLSRTLLSWRGTRLTWNKISGLWKASFSPPWFSLPSFRRCLWAVVLETGAWACTCHCSSPAIASNYLGPSGLQMFLPSVSVTDFIKVHSTFSQGGCHLGREEDALQARCWRCRGCSIRKEHLLSG